MELMFQFLVLAFTVLVWWLARRDLTRQAAEARSPAMAEWERLQDAVAALTADLERRAAAAEQRITDAEERLLLSEMRLRPMPNPSAPPQAAEMLSSGAAALPPSPPEARDDPYAVIHALIAAGITDAGEISHRTGTPVGEVELILGLRARQARL